MSSMRRLACAVVLAAALPSVAVVKTRQTELCQTSSRLLGVSIYAPTSSASQIESSIQSNPEVFWRPSSVHRIDFPWGRTSFSLRYPQLQDVQQILLDVAPLGRAHPDTVVEGQSIACPGVFLTFPPKVDVAFELRDNQTDEYRLAISSDERRALLSDERWALTGEAFPVPRHGDSCSGLDSVVRFKRITDSGLGSEFLTSSPHECGGLRKTGVWYLADMPFAAWSTYQGSCPMYAMPVMRLFNGSASSPNHRYTTREPIEREMVAQGWIAEGVAFCVPDGTHPYWRWINDEDPR